MKNPHGVEPTRFITRESKCAIYCNNDFIQFCGYFGNALTISDNCNYNNNSCTYFDSRGGYEYHPEYKNSLFVNSNDPDKRNNFIVSDYEVFTYKWNIVILSTTIHMNDNSHACLQSFILFIVMLK